MKIVNVIIVSDWGRGYINKMSIEKIKNVLNNINNSSEMMEAILESYLVHCKLRPCIMHIPKYGDTIQNIFPELIITPFSVPNKNFILVHHEDYLSVVEDFVTLPVEYHQLTLGQILGYWDPMTSDELCNKISNGQIVIFEWNSILVQTQRIRYLKDNQASQNITDELDKYNQCFSNLGITLSMRIQ